MSTVAIQALRRGLTLAWLTLLAMLLLLILVTNIVPRLGETLYIIRGSSMEPAIPIGALVSVGPVTPDDLRVGDIITMQHDSHQVITHRIIALETIDGQLHVRTRGDANQSADPGDHAFSDVLGRVTWHVPLAGFVLAFLSAPTGMIAVISFLGALLMATWLLEDLSRGRERQPLTKRSASGEATA